MKEKYQPSNGTEGMCFTDKFCDQCLHQNPNPEAVPLKNCDIFCRSLCFSATDPEYPSEWTYDDEGKPTCTEFVKWDWNNDGDPDDPGNPKAPAPKPDPNQLNIFPLYPNEDNFEVKKFEEVETLIRLQ